MEIRPSWYTCLVKKIICMVHTYKKITQKLTSLKRLTTLAAAAALKTSRKFQSENQKLNQIHFLFSNSRSRWRNCLSRLSLWGGWTEGERVHSYAQPSGGELLHLQRWSMQCLVCRTTFGNNISSAARIIRHSNGAVSGPSLLNMINNTL